MDYEVRELKYLYNEVKDGGNNPFGALSGLKFPGKQYNSILAGTALGEMLWSEGSLRKMTEDAVSALPSRPNTTTDVLLQGKFATINLHPAVQEAFPKVNFELKPSVNHMIKWINDSGAWEAKPTPGFFGKTIQSQEELLSRIPVRHADHDTLSYINSGVDEVQVYYGVTVLMEALVEMGFTDKELSEKPFHAFLYDPDISMRDNAYYYDNTINFTTYSPAATNYARDNPTIWHELGHGVMDRLMGPHLGFAGTKGGYGGLSEGMADFLAILVVQHQTNGANFPGKDGFRIINQIGFYLTNEYHDEGEAYGGAMNDMLDLVLEAKGRAGLVAFTDLTLEAMRLTRNHPALSARSWFEHMIYADELGSAIRAPGEFTAVINGVLKARNFAFVSTFVPAKMRVTFGNTELTSSSAASRSAPLTPCDPSGIVSYDLKVNLETGDADFITFPATVKVEYKTGALQGAVKWLGEENNPQVFELASAEEVLSLPIKASMECDSINQPNGSCKDYVYLQVFNKGDSRPRAKKRFYLQIRDKAVCVNE